MSVPESRSRFSVLGWLYDRSPRSIQQLFHGPTAFWFPWVVDEYKVRLIGLLMILLNLVVIIIMNIPERYLVEEHHRAGKWLATFVLYDFAARFFAGGRYSLLGLAAEILWLPFQLGLKWRKLVAGCQKQFAASVGTLFQAIAVIIFWSYDSKINRAVGSFVILMLLVAASLEAFCGFCLACQMMRWASKLKLFPPEVFDRCDSAYQDALAQVVEDDTYYREGKMKRGVLRSEGYVLTAKAATDTQLREYFNPVKHCHLTFLAMPLAYVACALAMRIADDNNVLTAQSLPYADLFRTSHPLTIFYSLLALVVLLPLLFLYVARISFYGRVRFRKDIDHFVRGNFFSAVPLILMCYAYLIASEPNISDDEARRTFAKVVFWLGAGPQMVFSVYWPARWIKIAMAKSTLNASFMIPVVGALVGAVVAPAVDSSYTEVAWMWLSWGVFMFVVLFVLTFQQRLFSTNSRDKLRMTDFAWLAAAAMASLGWQGVSCSQQYLDVRYWDPLEKKFLPPPGFTCVLSEGGRFWYFVAFGIMWVIGFAWLLKFYARHAFQMEYWVVVFAAAAMSAATTMYHYYIGSGLTKAMAYIGIIITNYLAAHMSLATLILLLRGRLFTPDEKWNAQTFAKGVHYALRGFNPKLVRLAKRVSLKEPTSITEFFDAIDMVHLVHQEHSQQEDRIMFPLLNAFFPTCANVAADEHKRDRAFFKSMNQLRVLLSDESGSAADKAAALEDLVEKVELFGKHVLEHLDTEELNMQAVPRKCMNNKLAKDVTKQMLLYTDWSKWRKILPWMMENIELHKHRVRTLKALEMAVPEYMQLVGQILVEKQTFTQFQRLAVEVPSIVPRRVYDNEYNRYW